ncbi:hypothetical protein CIHG_04017 [Coccidioides immitis H538.4]|uniref:Amino acid transporter transmembrane domain-containing protein n=1 Tax=Coccidioides immitis H538.4 TaxID=396776 RepID=A0A0J8RQH5_COCIT|nr:hypothetical protein CIHG_04017 [Coccidioides immitis H538.4]
MEIWLYFRSKRPYTQQELDVEKTGLQAASLRDFDARQRWSIFKSCNVEAESECNVSVTFQVEMEAGNSIKYRTCSWQKTGRLLFSEYICLAIVSFPYSYAVLGLIPGLILTAVIALIVLYTFDHIWHIVYDILLVRDRPRT